MRAVLAPEEQVATFLAAEPTLSIAAVNGPASTVVSGTLDALDRLSARLDEAGIAWRPLAVSHAFHSALLEPMLDGLEAAAGQVEHRSPQVPVISTLTGRVHSGFDAAYWPRHARQHVRFSDGPRTPAGHGGRVSLDLGPTPVLTTLAGYVLVEG